MPTKLPEQDEYNPVENPGDEHYKKQMEAYDSRHQEASGKTSDPRGEGPDKLLDRENRAAGDPSDPRGETDKDIASREEQGSSFINNVTEQPDSSRFKSTKNRAFLAISTLLVTITIFIFTVIFSGATSLLALKEVLTQKFDARMSSLNEKRSVRHMYKKMGKNMTSASCSVKVKCRYQGMSKTEVSKFERRNPGTKIETGRCVGAGIASRCSVKTIEFINDKGKKQTIQAKDFKKAFKSNKSLRDNVRKFNNSKVAMWRDKAAGKMFKKFKLFRGKLADESRSTLASNEEKDKKRKAIIQENLSGEKFDLAKGPKNIGTEEAPNTPEQDEANKVSGEVEDEINKAANEISEDPNAEAKDKIIKNSIKKLGGGPLAIAGSTCMAREVIRMASIAAKTKGALTLMRYAMLFMRVPDMMTYGDAQTTNSANAIGLVAEVLQKRDPGIDNPSAKNRTAFDSVGYQYAAYNILPMKNGKLDQGLYKQYSKFLLGNGTANKVADFMANSRWTGVLAPEFCGIYNATMKFIFGLPVLKQASAALGSVAGVVLGPILEPAFGVLVSILSNTLITRDENGNDAGNAITAGFASMSSNNAKARGAFPLSKDKAYAYDIETQKHESETAKDRGLAYQFNNANTKSFIGRLSAVTIPITSQFSSFSLNTIGQITNIPILSLNNLSSTVQAAGSNKVEYELCPDDDYSNELKVATDPFCNVQNGFNPRDVESEEGEKYDSEKVLEYMCGSPVADENSCTTRGYIDDEGNPVEESEYGKFVANCIESDKVLNSSEMYDDNQASGIDKKACEDPRKTGDETKYTMFRLYYFDTTIDDQFNDRGDQDGTNSGTPPTETSDTESSDSSESETVDGDTASVAQKLLDLNETGKVRLDGYSSNPSADKNDRSLSSLQLEDLAAGKKAALSTRCSYASSAPKTIAVDPKLLQFLVELGNETSYTINTLAGQCHSSANSQHHKGKAVDFGCPLDTAIPDRIAAKYGVKRNFETCAEHHHWHYSVGGN